MSYSLARCGRVNEAEAWVQMLPREACPPGGRAIKEYCRLLRCSQNPSDVCEVLDRIEQANAEVKRAAGVGTSAAASMLGALLLVQKVVEHYVGVLTSSAVAVREAIGQHLATEGSPTMTSTSSAPRTRPSLPQEATFDAQRAALISVADPLVHCLTKGRIRSIGSLLENGYDHREDGDDGSDRGDSADEPLSMLRRHSLHALATYAQTFAINDCHWLALEHDTRTASLQHLTSSITLEAQGSGRALAASCPPDIAEDATRAPNGPPSPGVFSGFVKFLFGEEGAAPPQQAQHQPSTRFLGRTPDPKIESLLGKSSAHANTFHLNGSSAGDCQSRLDSKLALAPSVILYNFKYLTPGGSIEVAVEGEDFKLAKVEEEEEGGTGAKPAGMSKNESAIRLWSMNRAREVERRMSTPLPSSRIKWEFLPDIFALMRQWGDWSSASNSSHSARSPAGNDRGGGNSDVGRSSLDLLTPLWESLLGGEHTFEAVPPKTSPPPSPPPQMQPTGNPYVQPTEASENSDRTVTNTTAPLPTLMLVPPTPQAHSSAPSSDPSIPFMVPTATLAPRLQALRSMDPTVSAAMMQRWSTMADRASEAGKSSNNNNSLLITSAFGDLEGSQTPKPSRLLLTALLQANGTYLPRLGKASRLVSVDILGNVSRALDTIESTLWAGCDVVVGEVAALHLRKALHGAGHPEECRAPVGKGSHIAAPSDLINNFVPAVQLEDLVRLDQMEPPTCTLSRTEATPAQRLSIVSKLVASAFVLQSPDTMLNTQMRRVLHHHLPTGNQLQDWRNVYSTKHHGVSQSRLFTAASLEQASLLVMKVREADHSPKAGTTTTAAEDVDTTIIGAFLGAPLKMQSKVYHGSGETFVFRFSSGSGPMVNKDSVGDSKSATPPIDHATPLSRLASAGYSQNDLTFDDKSIQQHQLNHHTHFECWRWQHTSNEYFVNCKQGLMLAIGGPTAAIYVDGSLNSGTTASCPTFGSPPLVGPAGSTVNNRVQGQLPVDMDILEVELYGFGWRAGDGGGGSSLGGAVGFLST
eukprot:GILI01013651.1.p1 GENE.GILI01013651.1~~GILI01013651.1.p1  ORF type:complete len:1081 (-),score=193.81 GILI01013651.1:205-3312(-)